MMGEDGGLHVTTGEFFQNGAAVSCAWIKRPAEVVHTRGWILGNDGYSRTPPTVVPEAGILHALTLVYDYLVGKQGDREPTYIVVNAGSGNVNRQLRAWFMRGTLRLSSAMASEIAIKLCEIIPLLKCALILDSLPPWFFDDANSRGSRPQDIILGTAERLLGKVLPFVRGKWGERIAHLPWTNEETKAHLSYRYNYDEGMFIRRLKGEGSMACDIFGHFRLTRGVVRSVLGGLQANRAAQVAISSLLCGTRFKYYDKKGNLLTVMCPFCGEGDSFEHFLKCRRVKQVPEGEEELVSMLRALALKIEKGSPAQPKPIQPITEMELNLGWWASSEEEISLSN